MVLNRTATFLILFASAVIVRLLFHFLSGFTVDDAFITFRYAENLVSGHGFVFNLGEKVLGTTTPLFTFLISIFLLFNMTALNAALLINLICSGLTAIVIFQFARHLRFNVWSFVPALIYILWPRSLAADSSGMETAFFTLLVTSAWYFQHRQLYFYSVGMATLACVTRPEGFFLLGLLIIYNAIKDSRNIWAYLIVPALIIIPWFIFSYLYFGTIVPSSISGKLALYSHVPFDTPWEKFDYIMGLKNPFGWIMLSVAIVGGWWLHKKQNFGQLEILWIVGMVAFHTFSRTTLFFWYVTPVYPMLILFAAAAIPFLWERFGAASVRFGWMRLTMGVVMVFGLLVMDYRHMNFYKEYARYLNDVHKSIGLYLRENAKPTDVVAARYIGHTGYYSNLKILDRDGMVTPRADSYNREGNFIGFILDNRPEWVVAAPSRLQGAFANSGEFLDNYHKVKTFGWEERVIHNIYRRTNGR